jgi:hypothetical protein
MTVMPEPAKISVTELKAIGENLVKHNEWLKTDEGKLFRAQQWIEHYRQKYFESLEIRSAKEVAEFASRRKEKHRPRRHGKMIGDPISPWFAFAECKAAGIPIPQWVLDHLAEVASAVIRFVQHPSETDLKNFESSITEIFGFKTSGKTGRGNVVSRYMDNTDLMLAIKVKWKIESGSQQKYAIEDVANEHKKSESTVRRAWKKYERQYSL